MESVKKFPEVSDISQELTKIKEHFHDEIIRLRKKNAKLEKTNSQLEKDVETLEEQLNYCLGICGGGTRCSERGCIGIVVSNNFTYTGHDFYICKTCISAFCSFHTIRNDKIGTVCCMKCAGTLECITK